MKKMLQLLYLALTTLERRFFEIFSFLVYRSPARVIAVGNLSLGGSGKTPILFELLSELQAHHRLCVLSRGYRSPWERSFYHLQGAGPHPEGLTDEALLLNQRFGQIPLLLGKNRHHAAIMAQLRLRSDLILLDDGFQYRRLRKDLNLLLWDAMSTPAEAQLLPLGRLREPLSRLASADVILLTRCESVSETAVADWQSWLEQKAPGKPIIKVITRCDGLFDQNNRKLAITANNADYLAFSAIGRPQSFYAQLEKLGINIVDRVEFRDHHRFNATELNELAQRAQSKKLQLVCTEKDLCKISPEQIKKFAIKVIKIRMLPSSHPDFSQALAAVGIRL